MVCSGLSVMQMVQLLPGVPRILENTLPPHLSDTGDLAWTPYAEYMETTRINVNVRQVFPKDFVPDVDGLLVSLIQC